MKFVLVAVAVACLAGIGQATDLVITDAATVMHVQATAERQVIRNGDYVGTCRGFRGQDDTRQILYDTLYEAVYVARRPYDSLSFAWQTFDWAEWMERVCLSQTPDGDGRQIFVAFGPKRNQASANVDVWEAGRRMASDECWYFISTSWIAPVGWSVFAMPFYLNRVYSEAIRLQSVPLGDFEYVTVHVWTVFGDTVRFDNDFFPGCRRSFWTSDTVSHPQFPEYPVIPVILPDPADPPGMYRAAWDSLGIPPGSYELLVKTAWDSLVREESSVMAATPGDFELILTQQEVEQYPTYVEFVGSDSTYSAVLGLLEFVGVPQTPGGAR